MLYETVPRAEGILGVNIEELAAQPRTCRRSAPH